MSLFFRLVAVGALVVCSGAPAHGAPASSAEVTAGNRFNPDISVILEGNAYRDDEGGEADERIADAAGINEIGGGHGHGGGHAGEAIGFNLKPAEFVFSASVDPYFDAYAQFVVTESGDLNLEETYLTTRELPAGLRVKAGQFLSGIGYHNEKHRHQWAFIEQNLPYQHLLGDHGLMGTGVQLTWTPLTPVYTRFGVEALQGDQAVVGRFDGEDRIQDLEDIPDGALDRFADPKGGPRLFNAFAKLAPDLGYSHELQMGLFGVFAGEQQEVHIEPDHVLRGDYGVVGTDWVYAYDAPHQYGKGDLKISAEYLYAVKDLEVAEHAAQPKVGDDRTFREDGFYVQGRYGFAANWRAALRYDAVGAGINEKTVGATGTSESWDASHRVSAVLTWTPTHYSRLQAQWSGSDIATESGRERVSQYFLRFIASMGQHGAHDF